MPERRSHNVLLVGSGGREDALAWKLAQSSHLQRLYIAPGNAGTARFGENISLADTNVAGIRQFVAEHNIDITVIGPETPLEAGLSDALIQDNRVVFGPSQEAAKLETSKAYAIEFMREREIPHPETEIFTDPDAAIAYVRQVGVPIVIKANGLAAGKGVFLPDTPEKAAEHIHAIHRGTVSGIEGDTILIQERLHGTEASLLAFTDGTTVVPLIAAQDYKRAHDGDRGPNTGGMGSFAPAPLEDSLLAEIRSTIVQPTIDGMADRKSPYKGIIYVGLMLTDTGPYVIEYNARFGDPETQPLMSLMSSDVLEAMHACARGDLSEDMITFKDGAAVCVVLAEQGYPGPYEKGHEIHGLDVVRGMPGVEVFHAGTRQDGDRILTAGGRVLGVTGYGRDLEEAVQRAYGAIGQDGVWFEGMHYRRDIAVMRAQ